jgi:hypothetical protein
MSITTMGDKTQAFDIFQAPLSSHYPLPLKEPPSGQMVLGLIIDNISAFNFEVRDLLNDALAAARSLPNRCSKKYLSLPFDHSRSYPLLKKLK